LNCANNFYFYGGQCLAECPIGYYEDSALFHCIDCPRTCLTCSSGSYPFFSFFFLLFFCSLFFISRKKKGSTCTSCGSEYSLYEGECKELTQSQSQNQNRGLNFLSFFFLSFSH